MPTGLLLALFAADPVVLISLRGASDAEAERLLQSGVLRSEGGFARLGRQGRRAALAPVAGAVTATAAATLLTGAAPSRHGITGNVFHRAGTPPASPASGFDTPLAVESLPEAAVRQGKRVVSIAPILGHGSAGAVLRGRLVQPATRQPYRPARYANAGGPPEFLRAMEAAAGVWPGYADNEALAAGDLTRAEFVAQAERFRAFKIQAAVAVLRAGNFDLLLFDENTIDNLGHQGYPPEVSYALADRSLAALFAAAPPAAVFVVASSHAMGPVERAVPLDPLLPPGARAFAYGPVAHLRVPAGDRAALRTRLQRNPDFERVTPGTGPHSGDLVVYARAGLVLSNTAAVHRFPADHGWLRGERAYFAMLGPRIRPGRTRPVRAADVAPAVRRLLGLR